MVKSRRDGILKRGQVWRNVVPRDWTEAAIPSLVVFVDSEQSQRRRAEVGLRSARADQLGWPRKLNRIRPWDWALRVGLLWWVPRGILFSRSIDVWQWTMTASVQSAITVTKLGKTYGSRRVLDEVSLRVQAGEMVALIGPSGAGKSTLMRHVSGLVSGDSGEGEVQVRGAVMQRGGRLARDVRRLRRQVGFVFQQFNLVGRLSLLENVLIGKLASIPWYRRAFRWFTRDEQRKAMQALDFVGMAEYAAQRASTLSGGQQQRAAIARALMQEACILLADEPIASLDPESARLVMEGLRRLNQEEAVTVLVSLHQVDYAQRFCDRIIAMKSGRIASDLSARELRTEHLQAIYGANYTSWSESSA